MGFKRATPEQRESEIKTRTHRSLGYVSSDIPIFNTVDGDNQIRIVPPLSDDKHASLWGLEVWTYFIANKSIVSNKTFNSNNRDPVQEYFFNIRESQPDEARKFKGTKRHLMFVLDLNDGREKLKLWAAPPTLVDEFIRLAKNRRTGELIPLEDPEQGRVIFFTKTGSGINTKYSGVEVDPEPSPIQEELADELETFEDMLIILSEDEMDSIVSTARNGEESTDAPAPRRRTKSESQQVNSEISFDADADTPPPMKDYDNDNGSVRDRVRSRLKNRTTDK